ncbi:MAG: hypothetical protein V7K77_11445 [Nostoc sp.]|uniref:hypothetical protein n=1 Tax=Nostoc sp. TaxID=1180 RepID=UPI002FFA540C
MSRTTVPFLTNFLTMLFCTQYWCCTYQKVRSPTLGWKRSQFLNAQHKNWITHQLFN